MDAETRRGRDYLTGKRGGGLPHLSGDLMHAHGDFLRTATLRFLRLVIAFAFALAAAAVGMPAQFRFDTAQLDSLASRIALYPDALVAQVLSASTYPEQIEEAAAWADGHSYLSGNALADAIEEDNLPWDASVLSLLPFPSILDTMASDEDWTRQLGEAVLEQRTALLNEIQALRHRASQFGYLRDTAQCRVVATAAGDITIMPVDPECYYVPVYDPEIVFERPRDRVTVGIRFGPVIPIGTVFEQWGWRRSGFDWPAHALVLGGSPWLRTRQNAKTYQHPYRVSRPPAGPRVERHELHPSRLRTH